MSVSRMLGVIEEFGSRADIQRANYYAARGRVESIATLYSRIVGNDR